MRFSIFAFAVMLAACFSHGRSLASIRKDAFDSFISEMANIEALLSELKKEAESMQKEMK